MLDSSSIEWQTTRHPGVFIHILRRDESSGSASVFIRTPPFCAYPSHHHNGIEEVLVLQGGYRDDCGVRRPGDYIVNNEGSIHYPVALNGAEDCIMFAVAYRGIELI